MGSTRNLDVQAGAALNYIRPTTAVLFLRPSATN